MLTHNEVIELLPAHALDTLNDDEAMQVAEHVAGCAACQAELHALQVTVGYLGLAVPPAAPSPQVQTRLLERIRPPAPPAAGGWWPRQLAALRQFAPVWGLVGLVLIVGLLVSNIFLWQQIKIIRQTAAPMMTIPLSSTQAAPLASGLIIITSDGEYGSVVVENLPPLPAEQQYQLWLIQKDGSRATGPVFSVDEEGYQVIKIESETPLIQFAGFGITIEPAGGSAGPTGAKVLGSL